MAENQGISLRFHRNPADIPEGQRQVVSGVVLSVGDAEEPLQYELRIARELLWMRHGCQSPSLYGDDGELQCHACGIDFKRSSMESIQNSLFVIGRERLKEHLNSRMESE